ncbi:MAG: 3-phosphoshikimate 1-carboxyvinyltransferase [Candidatus Omnitrophota bacterium]|nr:3-phosphoshikimate 1-carboxyvinyltransferase [Candidatus Omnitrophota bacterium]
MDAIIHHAGPLHGTLVVPPDKAICHRAVLAAALADGQTILQPWPAAEDCQRTLEAIRSLGVSVERTADTVRISGRGRQGLCAPQEALDCGESGTTFRLLAGLLAGQPFESTLTAGPSLSQRPMRRIVEPLRRMGARVEGRVAADGSQEVYAPVTIHGRHPLRAIRYEMPIASAQVKSTILLAGLSADGRTTVVEPHQTRDHTERILRACGVRLHREGGAVSIDPRPLNSPGPLTLPRDFSSAAFFVVAACCAPGSRIELSGVGLNPTRASLLEALRRMGAKVHARLTEERWEPNGSIVVESFPLQGIAIDAEETPGLIDELPILMVAAACAQGTTRLSGLGELRVKETDRIRSMVDGLKCLGIPVRLPAADAVEIDGARLVGAEVESAGDHRTAMSLAVAGLIAEGQTVVRGAECVAKSYPEFFDHLRAVTPPSTVKTVDKA